jgi:hypothetical protein
MNWIEGFHIDMEMRSRLKRVPGCSSTRKTNEKRKAWIRNYIDDNEQYGRGNWIAYAFQGGASIRLSFVPVPGVPRPIPATILIVNRLPLWEALQHQDDYGPIRFERKEKAWTQKEKRQWLMEAGREFAFQVADCDEDEEDHQKCRERGDTLKPNPKLRELLRSKKPVVQLEVIAALATRDVMKKENLSEIVKAELTTVMREAKHNGEAVVFCLGSSNPHTLAKKVYLRQPIGDYGLQCGYFRWRDSPDLPWARERCWENRICCCLQMP